MPPPPKDEFQLLSVTVIAGQRCPTCHQLPPAFDATFGRWVETAWVDTSRKGTTHYTMGADGKPRRNVPGEKARPGFACVVIVPFSMEGKWVLIKEEDDLDRARKADKKAYMREATSAEGA